MRVKFQSLDFIRQFGQSQYKITQAIKKQLNGLIIYLNYTIMFYVKLIKILHKYFVQIH